MKPITYRNNITIHAPEFEESDIFKYGPLEYLKLTLENCTIKFTKLDLYNDPFETKFQYRHRFNHQESRNNFLKNFGYNETKPDKIQCIASEHFDSMMVTCFSLTPSEPLMWSHYADEHKGVCYCFNKLTVFNQYRSGDIRYSSHLPTLDYFEGSSSVEHLKPQFDDIILTKSDNWSHEKEYRFFKESNILAHDFNPSALEGVIIGARVEEEDVKKIVGWIDEYNKKHSLTVKVLHAHTSGNSYSMRIGYNSLAPNRPVTCPIYCISEPII